MAGHSKFKNIMHRKGAQDARRAKKFTKLIREIMTAAKIGNPDPDFNPRLRLAINQAKVLNLPKDRIENAIKKASSDLNTDNYDEMRYEGYMPGGIAIIVEALTDNKNRTASDVRAAFTKYGGNLGETNSVNFMFDRIGFIEYSKDKTSADEMLESAIEADADDCQTDEIHHITCSPDMVNLIREKLTQKYGDPENSGLSWKAKDLIAINLENAEKLMKFIDVLEDNDDIQNIYGNYLITDEIIEKLNS